MTEHEWLTCRTTPKAMLRKVRTTLSARKARLVSAACSRLIRPDLYSPTAVAAIERLELVADGVISEDEYLPVLDVHQLRAEDLRPFDDPRRSAGYAVVSALVGGSVGLERCIEHVVECVGLEASDGQRLSVKDRIRGRVCDLFREIVGNPFRPWASVPEFLGGGVVQPDGKTVQLSRTARDLAESVHADQGFDRLPVLADALEECGVTDPDILAHCRDGTGHVRGCWALDVARGK